MSQEPTPAEGIRYYTPLPGAVLSGRDGRFFVECGGLPLPILEEDYAVMEADDFPSYDSVGKGIHALLRRNPDCAYGATYARMLQDGYPHIISEIATQAVMLDKKDVEVLYLDRMATALRILWLLEPDNARFPLQIGWVYRDRGLRLSGLNQATTSLYRAESFLLKGVELDPVSVEGRLRLAEVSYLLGKYEEAARHWGAALPSLPEDQQELVRGRLRRIEERDLPLVPPVDYLEGAGMAMAAYDDGDYEEAAAIVADLFADSAFSVDFPLPELHYLKGIALRELGMAAAAEEAFVRALSLQPDYHEAAAALAGLKEGA